VQDQLAGLAGTATQLDPCAGREGLGGKAQAERQGLVAAAQVAAGQQALRATALIDHQQRQFDFGARRHALQGAAQFPLISGQRAEVGCFPGLFLCLLRRRARRWRLRLGLIAATGHQQGENTEQNERS